MKAMPAKPSFIIHTGDITYLSKPAQFDNADKVFGETGVQVHYVPGEHDYIDEENGKAYLERYGKGAKGAGWYSFDDRGVLYRSRQRRRPEGRRIGQPRRRAARLAGGRPEGQVQQHADRGVRAYPLADTLQGVGMGTQDGTQALALLKRFGSVTILNGHIHQLAQKVEGNMTFHTALSTAFPQPAPGTAPSPGPMLVPADKLRSYLGLSSNTMLQGNKPLAIVDRTLAC